MIRKLALLTITSAILALAPLGRAQTQEPNLESVIEVTRAEMQADRVTVITATMNFSHKDAAAFWPIYRSYEYKRSQLDDLRAAVIQQYAEKYSTLNDTDAKSMAEQILECDSRLAELRKTYFRKFSKVLPALTVTKFFQLDRRIDLVMDMKVEASLPPVAAAASADQTN